MNQSEITKAEADSQTSERNVARKLPSNTVTLSFVIKLNVALILAIFAIVLVMELYEETLFKLIELLLKIYK